MRRSPALQWLMDSSWQKDQISTSGLLLSAVCHGRVHWHSVMLIRSFLQITHCASSFIKNTASSELHGSPVHLIRHAVFGVSERETDVFVPWAGACHNGGNSESPLERVGSQRIHNYPAREGSIAASHGHFQVRFEYALYYLCGGIYIQVFLCNDIHLLLLFLINCRVSLTHISQRSYYLRTVVCHL